VSSKQLSVESCSFVGQQKVAEAKMALQNKLRVIIHSIRLFCLLLLLINFTCGRSSSSSCMCNICVYIAHPHPDVDMCAIYCTSKIYGSIGSMSKCT